LGQRREPKASGEQQAFAEQIRGLSSKALQVDLLAFGQAHQ
jgi:hypothetical protein